MINDIRELNETFYELFGRIASNRAFLTDAEFKFMHEKLFDLYREEHKRLYLNNEIERKNSLYELESRCNELTPHRRWFFFKNRQMKAVDKRLENEFNEHFKKLLEVINAGCINNSPINGIKKQDNR